MSPIWRFWHRAAEILHSGRKQATWAYYQLAQDLDESHNTIIRKQSPFLFPTPKGRFSQGKRIAIRQSPNIRENLKDLGCRGENEVILWNKHSNTITEWYFPVGAGDLYPYSMVLLFFAPSFPTHGYLPNQGLCACYLCRGNNGNGSSHVCPHCA